MTTTTVFAPSLLGGKQEAVLGLHDSWSATDICGAPPPPLMVMTAAMLRSQRLDDVRLAPPRASVACDGQMMAPQREDRECLVTLVANGEVEACREVRLVPVLGEAGGPWGGAFQLYNTNSYTCLQCCFAAIRTGNVAAFGAALQRVINFYAPNENRESTLDGLQPLCRQDFTPQAVRDVLECFSSEASDGASVLNRAEMARVLRQCQDEKSHRQAPLRSMGDLRCLLLSHSTDTDATPLLQRILSDLDPSDAILALAELGHADMGSMVLAVLGSVPTAQRFTDVYQNTRNFEMRYISSRHVIIKIPQGEPTLMAAHDSDGRAVVRIAAPLSDDTHHVLLRDGWPPTTPAGSAAYRDRAAFEARRAAQLRGLLDGWDWSHCIAAGGAVVRALVGGVTDDDASGDTFGDVDLFFHGLRVSEVRARLAALERHVHAKVGPGRYVVLLTSTTMTIVIEDAPRLQVALGTWWSASDVLVNSDVDCCGAGYDGSRVVLTGRAAAAYAYRVNVGSASAHRVRGSPAYETRLWKYARRYRFAVLDPLHAPNSDVVVDARTMFTKKARVAATRHAVTSLAGLRWIMAAALGLLTPTLTTHLALGEGKSLTDLVALVSTYGYAKLYDSNGGETGYVVVQQAAADEVFDTKYLDSGNYFQYFTPLTTANFANGCLISDVDELNFDDDRPNPYFHCWKLVSTDVNGTDDVC